MTTNQTAHLTLTEHVINALHQQRDRLLTAAEQRGTPTPERDELRQQLDARHAQILASATHPDPDQRLIYIEPWADHSRPGRLDTRSARAVVWIRTDHGDVVLCDPLIKHPPDREGRPIDARATTRDILAQLQDAPDDITNLQDAPAPDDITDLQAAPDDISGLHRT